MIIIYDTVLIRDKSEFLMVDQTYNYIKMDDDVPFLLPGQC